MQVIFHLVSFICVSMSIDAVTMRKGWEEEKGERYQVTHEVSLDIYRQEKMAKHYGSPGRKEKRKKEKANHRPIYRKKERESIQVHLLQLAKISFFFLFLSYSRPLVWESRIYCLHMILKVCLSHTRTRTIRFVACLPLFMSVYA